MPRARSRRSSGGLDLGVDLREHLGGLGGSRAVRSRASRVFTDNATSCCWRAVVDVAFEPAALLSCARGRRCEARSSSTRRTLRRTRPACDARSRTRRSFDGFIGSLGGIATESAPRSSPWSRPRRRSRPPSSGGPRSRRRRPRARRWSATRLPAVALRTAVATLAEPAPVAWPRICAMRPRTSSVAYDSPTRSENSVSTSYGVALACRRRRDRRSAAEPRHRPERETRAAARR